MRSRLTVSLPPFLHCATWVKLTMRNSAVLLIACPDKKGLVAAIREMRKGSTVTSATQEQSFNALGKYARNLNELPHASLRRIRLERAMADGAAAPFPPAVRATVTLRLHYRQPGYDS